jgi:hypothetical protein
MEAIGLELPELKIKPKGRFLTEPTIPRMTFA